MDKTVIDFHTHPCLSDEEFMNFYPGCFTPSPVQAQKDLEQAGKTTAQYITDLLAEYFEIKENGGPGGFGEAAASGAGGGFLAYWGALVPGF